MGYPISQIRQFAEECAEVSLRSAFMNAALLLPILRLPATHKINRHSLLTGSFRRRLTHHSHYSIP